MLDASAAAAAEGGHLSRSGEDLVRLCDWITPRLRGQGLAPLALLLFSSCHAFLPVFWACLRLGQPVLPLALPGSVAEQQREAQRIAATYGEAGGTVLLLHDEGAAAFAQAITQQAPASTGLRRLSFSALCSAAESPPESWPQVEPLDPRAPAYLLETSGTTGRPRAACFSGESEPAELLDRAVLWLFPLSSSSGISGAFALHRLTAFLPLQEAIRDPDRLLALIEQLRITGFSMPPVLLTALLRHLRDHDRPAPRRDLSSLNRLNVGSAASSPSDLAELQQRLSDWGAAAGALHTGYGLTETGLLSWGPFEAEPALAQPPGETLIGPLYDEVETRLIDGVLQVRKPFSFLGYLRHPCISASGALELDPFRSGTDWFDTGDRARLLDPPQEATGGDHDTGTTSGADAAAEARPRLVLCGRAKDILVINSRKLSLPAIEQSLVQHCPGGLELACACALPPRSGEANEGLLLALTPVLSLQPTAAEPSPELSALESSIQAHLLERFGLVASQIHWLEAAAFPRTSTGKIRKADLIRELQRSADPRAGAADTDAAAVAPSPAAALPPPAGLEQHMQAWLRRHAPLQQPWHRQQKLSAFGIDSLAFAALIGELERRHGRRCRLERCPADPSLDDLLALFTEAEPVGSDGTSQLGAGSDHTAPPRWISDPRSPAQVLLRHDYEQLLRAANLASDGEPLGLGGIARLHNAEASGTPLVLLSPWPLDVIAEIATSLHDHPVFVLRLAYDFANPVNHQYLLFCYLEWLESCLLPLQRPYILAGNCRGSLLSLELAQLLQARQLQPQLTLLLQWDPALAGPGLEPYSGAVAYQIHRDHHGGDPEQARELIIQLARLTPDIRQVVLSATPYNAESAYPVEQQPYQSLIRLVRALGSTGVEEPGRA